MPFGSSARAPGRVAAILLAAGASTRMGTANKLLLDVGGAPMVRRICAAALASRARPVIVVTGHEAERVRDALGDLPVAVAHNPEFSAGMSTSIRHGIEALPGDIDGALFVLGDMPRVETRHLDTLIEAFTGTGATPERKDANVGDGLYVSPKAMRPAKKRKDRPPLPGQAEIETDDVRARICAPSHRGRRGNPVLWGAHYLPELRELRGDRGARALLDQYANRVRLVEMDDGVIVDVDTPRAAAAFGRYPGATRKGSQP